MFGKSLLLNFLLFLVECCVCNSSLEQGYVPTQLKHAVVVAVPKCHPPMSVGSDLLNFTSSYYSHSCLYREIPDCVLGYITLLLLFNYNYSLKRGIIMCYVFLFNSVSCPDCIYGKMNKVSDRKNSYSGAGSRKFRKRGPRLHRPPPPGYLPSGLGPISFTAGAQPHAFAHSGLMPRPQSFPITYYVRR